MILIDKPFVSDFLIETIRRNNFPIVATPETKNMISDMALNWISEKEAKTLYNENPNMFIYTNSENSIGWIENNFSSSNLPQQIELFKNKVKFRELLKEIYPDYFFKSVRYDKLKYLDINEIKFPFIIKPAVGFFSIAVHKVDKPEEWQNVLREIETEVQNLEEIYPEEVINTTNFIIEEFIHGEEYAIDCYFDSEGTPVLLNILQHLFSSDKDVSDRVYLTSKEIIERHQTKIQEFLKVIGWKTKLKNFPAHIEIRIDNEGELNPIEINPLRFGGWCTTGDLSWYAYGFNSYEYFFSGRIPDWEKIFKSRKDKIYSIIVLDNNSGIDERKIDYFDYDLLLNDFEKPMTLRKVDFKKYSVFGFLFAETTKGNAEEISNILTSDLRKYIKIKNH